jgi:opacity protein-like surface antigen
MKKILVAAMLVMTLASVASAQRVLINKGDQYVGAKLALGSIGGASMGFIGNYEMGYQENIGIGASIAYSGYSETIGLGEWSYSNLLIMASGTYHMDLLKNEKLDTWGALNLGYNIASAEWKWSSNPFNLPNPTASVGGVVFGLTANARYSLTEQLFATASVGFGLGILNIGIDYKL